MTTRLVLVLVHVIKAGDFESKIAAVSGQSRTDIKGAR